MKKHKSLSQRIGEPWASIVHVLCGAGCVLLYLFFPLLALGLGALFCLIEIVQVWTVKDQGWGEMIQFGIGAAVTALIVVLLTIMGVLNVR